MMVWSKIGHGFDQAPNGGRRTKLVYPKEEETKEVIAAIAPKIVVPMHYRINELESNAEHPVNLGGIEDYFTNRMNVIWLESNSVQLSKSDLPDQLKYMVFKHSDAVYN